MGQMLRVIVAALLIAPRVFAAEPAIVGGGQRIIDIDPAGTTCRAWSYAPMPVANEAGSIDTVYSAGDLLSNHCSGGLTSTNRFGDAIWRHARNGDGSWRSAAVISRDSFPWMSGPTVESYVSHLASPAVVREGGRWYMAFAGSVSDPNLCAGEHGSPTQCGSCTSPWSHFAVFWAVSDDGATWRVRDRGGDNANPALAAALLWRDPNAADTAPGSGYKGFARVSMVAATEGGKTFFYILGMFWGARSAKEVLVRVPYDATNEWGLGGPPEIVHFVYPSHVWESCVNGRLPDWVDDFQQYSVVTGFFNAFTASVFTTTRVPGYRYAALGVANAAGLAGFQGSANAIVYQLSNDLITWTPQRYLRSSVDFLADGRGYSASIIDPIGVEDAGGTVHLYVASDDGNGSGARDGLPDCKLNPDFGPTAPYVGAGIYEATLGWVDLPATTITVTPPASPVTTGAARYSVRVTAADGSIPTGIVTLYSTDFYAPASASLHDGVADVTLTATIIGPRVINATYNTLGPFQNSSTTLSQTVAAPPPRRRGVKH